MLLVIFLIAIVGKIYEYNFLGDKAFNLINYVLKGIFEGRMTGYKSVDFPVKVLSIFKFLNLTTPVSSGIFCAIVMNIVCFIILLIVNERYNLREYIFIYVTIFILDFTVFDFNKDIIQFWIVLIIYWVVSKDKLTDNKKILITILILLVETVLFRNYYILICGLFPMIFFLMKGISSKERKKKIIFRIILIMVFFFSTVYVMQVLSYSSYIELISRRNNLETIEANTIIRNLILGNSFISFCANYFINLIRCMFPVELCIKGLKYMIFAFYQLYISINIIVSLRNINKTNIIQLSFILAYCMTMAASESDFGTFVRHQSVLLLFYLYIIVQNHYRKALLKKGLDV